MSLNDWKGVVGDILGAQHNAPTAPLRVKYTEADYDVLTWENFQVSNISLACGTLSEDDVAEHNLSKEFVLNLDCLVELLPNGDYWHSLAELEFHGITDLNVIFATTDSGFQNGTSTFIMGEINRELVSNQKVYLDRPYYSWTIQLCNPAQTCHLAFGAYGFTLFTGKAVLSKGLNPPQTGNPSASLKT